MTPKANYANEAALPDLVRRAVKLARELSFENSCHPGYGRLLRVLAARGGRVLETGSGCGVGTAWMLSGLPSDATLTTVEVDPTRAAAVKALFAGDSRVRVIEGDAAKILLDGPFDFFFMDGGFAAETGLDPVVDLLTVGGVVVKDDLKFGTNPQSDPRKAPWFSHQRLAVVEVMAAPPEWSAIIAVRTA